MKRLFFAALVLLMLLPLVAQETIDLSDTGPGIKEISLTNQGFLFIPKEIKVKRGDTVRLTFTNSGGFHDWKIDEFNAATRQIPAGKSDTVEFVADKAGRFEYYCSVGNHRARGMWGTFVVVE